MKRFLSVAAVALSAIIGSTSVAQAQSCTYHVLSRFHYTAQDGGDRACVVYQSADCSITMMCAG